MIIIIKTTFFDILMILLVILDVETFVLKLTFRCLNFQLFYHRFVFIVLPKIIVVLLDHLAQIRIFHDILLGKLHNNPPFPYIFTYSMIPSDDCIVEASKRYFSYTYIISQMLINDYLQIYVDILRWFCNFHTLNIMIRLNIFVEISNVSCKKHYIFEITTAPSIIMLETQNYYQNNLLDL